ncbi:hypothetical protein BGX28_002598 [Mortierella sp. GBA30]|nr:hypothetical protein BGX28_002598 [Mortierella sp. GBA30]
MSIVPALPSNTMTTTDRAVIHGRHKKEQDPVAIVHDSESSSPPVTPPVRSSGEDAAGVRSSLPSPPPSSSSRHMQAYNNQHQSVERHQSRLTEQAQDPGSAFEDEQSRPGIEKIARRLSTAAGNARPTSSTSFPGNKTHSSSSSMSSSASNHNLPTTLTNKHVSLTKTKTLGHLTRSTSSEVDNEVANALASGRIIMSKTDWKEEDAQYLVQLIETQFPKGNIIWDWVGQQMTSRGFTKSQCRSKWKRIRTKVLHGDQSNKERDPRDFLREQEADELIEEEEDELAEQHDYVGQRHGAKRWHHRQDHGGSVDMSGSAHGYRTGAHQSPTQAYEERGEEYHYDRPAERKGEHRFKSSPIAPSIPSYRSSASYAHSRQPVDRGSMEEDELLSDDDQGDRYDGGMVKTRRDYPDREHSYTRPGQQHYRRESNSNRMQQDVAEESSRPIPAIAATPISFGKIEWKTEDSDYLVRLIESKFASRKVDWAWVSKQMEGRGYDRTQCKSRWWRVQHRQNQSGQHSAHSHHGSTSQSVRGRQHRQSIDQVGDFEAGGLTTGRDKSVTSDLEGAEVMGDDKRSSRQGSTTGLENTRHSSGTPSLMDTDATRSQRNMILAKAKEHLEDVEGNGTAEDQTSSPRSARAHEHQKHIEWKEEDSQYMYRMIEKEFPVGNVVWSVIGERMASRGYSQTQCMSKWRRHLKNSKLSNDGNKAGTSMEIDLDLEGPLMSIHSERAYRSAGSRQRAEHERLQGEDRGDISKRHRTHSSESRRYEMDTEYQSPAPLDARLVEQEYDRYYDAGGKRKRIEDSGLRGGYTRQDQHIQSSYEEDRYDYIEEQTHRLGEGDAFDPCHPRERGEDAEGLALQQSRNRNQKENVHKVGQADGASLDAEYSNGGRGYSRDQDEAMALDEQEDQDQSKSTREPYSSAMYHPSQPSAREPHRRPVEKSTSYYQRSHSSAPSSHCEYYDPRADYYNSTGRNQSSVQYPREDGPLSNQSTQTRHRPLERDERGRPIARSPERDFVGTHSAGRKRMPRVDEEGGRSKERLPMDWSSRRREDRVDDSYSRHRTNKSSIDYDSDYGRDYGYGYDHGSRRQQRYDRQHPLRQVDDRDADMIDYALEDDMDWAAGRYESRDMARLAAAVARQGRRWDAIRAQIRVPVLVSPYDEREDGIYEGAFDSYPSTSYYRQDASRRSGYQQHHRSSSSVTYHHRQSSSVASKYGSSKAGVVPVSASYRSAMVGKDSKIVPSAVSLGRSRQASSSGFAERGEPMAIDLAVDERPDGLVDLRGADTYQERSDGAHDDVVELESVDIDHVQHADDSVGAMKDDLGGAETESSHLREGEQGSADVEADVHVEDIVSGEDYAEAGPSEQQVKALGSFRVYGHFGAQGKDATII